jgi:very-short-patch-repair endonuclease
LELVALQEKWKVSLKSWFLPKVLGTREVLKQLQRVQIGGIRIQESQVGGVLDQSIRLQKIHNQLDAIQPIAEETLGSLWNHGKPSAQEIELVQKWGDTFDKRLIGLAGDDLEWLVRLRQLLGALFQNGTESFGAETPIGSMLYDYLNAFSAYVTELNEIAEEVKLRRESIDGAADHFSAVRALIDRLESGWGQLRPWCAWQKIRSEAISLGMGSLVVSVENQSVPFEDMPQLFERSFRRDLLFALIERNVALRGFFGEEHSERIERFRQLDERLNQLARESIQTRLAVNVPRGDFKDIPNAETALLRKELGKKKRHIPVRRLLSNIPQMLPRLKPCVLMSPLSVAQYLDATHDHFDLVIFDEASQIAVWDAVGAIARAKQLIVVGDPKQLPPTNFFAKAADEDGEDEMSLGNEDLESILDELMSAGLRHKRLKWHYRSRHEGLITFSNREYYDNDLLTFPSSERESGGVKFRYIEKAYYDKGKSRTNKGEAKALVDELIQRLKDPQGSKKSYGVVTFSLAQQQLIEDLLDQKRREHPEVEVHFGDTPPVEGEPIFVKNLESVQGDERDVILFSICYGPDESGKVAMNFGPMNRDGGERRLNVAITRAKYEVVVFSSLKGDQIDLTRTRARGVRDLKSFLEYAERGPKALTAALSVSSDSEPDSEFELMVAKKIIEAGYEVHHQVGCSGYRIDLAVVDPKAPGRYLLGVECDGATYHRAATARDRDKLRQAILEGLGWKIYRIWSTDWWHDAEGQTKKLLFKLAELSHRQPDSQ